MGERKSRWRKWGHTDSHDTCKEEQRETVGVGTEKSHNSRVVNPWKEVLSFLSGSEETLLWHSQDKTMFPTPTVGWSPNSSASLMNWSMYWDLLEIYHLLLVGYYRNHTSFPHTFILHTILKPNYIHFSNKLTLSICINNKCTVPRIQVTCLNNDRQLKHIMLLLNTHLDYLITHLLTYSMVQSPSWEANWFAASQEIPLISRNPKVHYHTHKHPPPVPILGQPNPVHIPTTTSWRSILLLSTHLCLGLPSGLLPSGYPTKTLYTPLFSPICATCPAHLILLDFITRTILDEEYRSFSSSLCSLLHSPITSSLLGPNILLNTIFSKTLSFLSSLNVNDQVSHPYKTTGKVIVLYILIF